MNELTSETPDRQPIQGFALNYKRILSRAIEYWYWIVASLLLGVTIAYLVNRYTTRIYPVTASIIIRESQEKTDAQFLFNNSLVSGYRNFYNEPYIIRSYPIIQSVIVSLGFEISIQKEGNFLTTEQYQLLPLRLISVGEISPKVISLEVTDDKHFRCGGDTETEQLYLFGDTVKCAGNRFVVFATGSLKDVLGERYLIRFSDPQQVAASYISRLQVTWAQQNSSVVNLDISGPIPRKEIDFLNRLISFYQNYDLEKKNQTAKRSLDFIDNQLDEIGKRLRLYENELETFKKQNFITDLSSEAVHLYTELKAINEQHAAISYAENYYQYLDSYLARADDPVQIILPTGLGINDPVINELASRLVSLQTELNTLPQPKTSSNPMVITRAAQLRKGIQEVRAQLSESIKNQRQSDRIKVNGLNAQANRIERDLLSIPGAQRELISIQRNYTLNENLYLFLQQKRAEAGISQAATTSDIVVVNPPRLAGGASTPKVRQNYVIYPMAGVLLPFLIIVLMEILNTKIQSKEDIEQITQIPFIGGIGHNSLPTNLVVVEKPKSAMAESFRALRSNLNYFTGGQDQKVFMVTSSISGEGKTFTTINLATVLALSGKRTIIMGADLRRPKIFEDFQLGNDRGLSTYLSGLHEWQESIQTTTINNLDLITGGPVPPNPSELILSSRMGDLIAQLKRKYDFILIDTPPMGLITDALVLNSFADHTLYLVRQNYTPRELIKVADELYRSGKISKLSLVLNDVRKVGPGYGYGYYSYGYYGYGYYGSKRKKGDSNYYS